MEGRSTVRLGEVNHDLATRGRQRKAALGLVRFSRSRGGQSRQAWHYVLRFGSVWEHRSRNVTAGMERIGGGSGGL